MILAAGKGSRLGHITQSKPKALVEINGEPLLKINLLKLKSAGFHRIVVNVHHFANEIRNYLEENKHFGLDIQLSDESDALLDTGGGILNALHFFETFDAVLIHNVDVISNLDLHALIQTFNASNCQAMLVVRQRNSSRKLLFDQKMNLSGWENAQTGELKWVDKEIEPRITMAFSGIHLFRPCIFKNVAIEKCSIIDLYLNAAKHSKVCGYINETGFWYDLGRQEQLPSISKALKSRII